MAREVEQEETILLDDMLFTINTVSIIIMVLFIIIAFFSYLFILIPYMTALRKEVKNIGND